MSKIKEYAESMNAAFKTLEDYILSLEQKNQELVEANKALIDTVEKLTIVPVKDDTTKIEIFDPIIHMKKPSRPMTKEVRSAILKLYNQEYKEFKSIKDLSEFFSVVNAEIAPTASKSEIQGVIYNRYDERLYL